MTRGFIIPIGGAEDKIRDAAILRRFASICGGSDARIAVIPTASQLLETAEQYLNLFGSFGVADVFSLDFEDRSDCKREDWLERLREADGVFITGGNQLRLSTTIGGTEVSEFIRTANREAGLHVAGTSAGASIMAEHMIAYGEEGSTPRSEMVTLVPGLGLTHSIVVDQHFRQRDRLGRLLTALAYNPRIIGVGLDEDTAAFISPDQVLEVMGSGAITIVDAAEMECSTMDTTRRHEPVCLTNLRLHILVAGGTFNLETREALPAPSRAPS